MMSPDVYALSPGRLGAIVAVLVGVAGVVMGGLAMARSGSRSGRNERRSALVALMTGLLGAAIGGLIVATSGSGIGTGKGWAGQSWPWSWA